MQVTVTLSAARSGLITLRAQPEGRAVNLTWITTNEKDVSGFDIEKKTANSWEKIGKMLSDSSVSGKYFFRDNHALAGSNSYRLKADTPEDKPVYSNIINVELKEIVVFQNVPNPFSSVTTIKYEVPREAPVNIVVYNTIGIPVAILANEIKKPGSYEVQWNAGNRVSGMYYYKVFIGDMEKTMGMLKLN